MKRKITLSVALALSVALLSLIGSATASAQAGNVFTFPVSETGLVLIEPGKILAMTVRPKGQTQVIEVESCSYGRSAGPGGGPHVKLTCDQRRVTVRPNEAYSFEYPGSDILGGYSVKISSSRPLQLIVQGQVIGIDPVTGRRGMNSNVRSTALLGVD